MAAPAPARAAEACVSSVATYVNGPTRGSNPAFPRTFTKYMDWGPKSGESTLFDTQITVSVPALSKFFTGGQGVIYEIRSGRDGLRSHKDNTATGGALLTPVKTYNFDWSTARRAWSNGPRIFVVHDAGNVGIFRQAAPSTGGGAITQLADVPASAGLRDLIAADDVWMVGSTIYTLADGAIKHRTYTETKDAAGAIKPTLGASATDATGLTAVQAWSPGPGAVNTLTNSTDPDTTGRIAKYTTGPFAQVNDDLATGIRGDVMADTASCLADPAPDAAPYFGTPPADDDTDIPVAQEPGEGTAPAPAPAPAPANTVTGRFVLGNGQPSPGMQVTVTAADLDAGKDGAAEPVLGTATTAADGTWSLTLPSTLPTAVKQAMADNGGALNLNATTSGTTASGVKVLGTDALTAVPVQPATAFAAGTTAETAAEAVEDGHTQPLVPNTVTEATAKIPTPEQEKQALAAQAEADPEASDGPTPLWQSDHSTLAANYNPYLVAGKDVSAEKVTPMASGSCSTLKFKEASKTKYTVVGEAHANWDSKATFEYDSTLNSAVDIAVNSNGNWKIGGSRQMSSETGVSTGYTNQGSYFAKQYKVPIEYIRYKKQTICGATVRATWYTVEPGRYKVPASGSVGAIGKDVRYKDGSANYSRSPRSHRARVEPGTYFQLSKKKSAKFGNAVTFFNVGLGVTTGYDTNHKQKITAGVSRAKQHLIWGKNGPIHGTPGVFYSN